MARRTRTRRLLGTIAGTALATGAALVTAPPTSAETAPTAAASVTVRPDPSYKEQSFEGWGTSLVWFANATGNYPAPIREKLAKLLFGNDGLNLNIARYNIGGGNAPDVKNYLRAGGAVEGWWKAPDGTTRTDTDWWSADDAADWNPPGVAVHRSRTAQRVIRALAPAMQTARTGAKISAMDETNPNLFTQNWNSYRSFGLSGSSPSAARSERS